VVEIFLPLLLIVELATGFPSLSFITPFIVAADWAFACEKGWNARHIIKRIIPAPKGGL